MKKLIAKVFGVELHANAQNINGKKSSGVEDYSSYNNWRANYGQGQYCPDGDVIN